VLASSAHRELRRRVRDVNYDSVPDDPLIAATDDVKSIEANPCFDDRKFPTRAARLSTG